MQNNPLNLYNKNANNKQTNGAHIYYLSILKLVEWFLYKRVMCVCLHTNEFVFAYRFNGTSVEAQCFYAVIFAAH